MRGETALHSQSVATVFRLLNITWCPGTLEQNHVLGTMEGEANATGSEGRQQHVGRSVLKTINGRLTIRWFLPPVSKAPPIWA